MHSLLACFEGSDTGGNLARLWSVGNQGKSAKSGNQKSSCCARAALLLRIAPFTVVNYKADPAAARAYSFRPAGHTLERPRNPKSVGNQ